MLKLDATDPSFIRCIQPNKRREPDNFDQAVVLTQLRYTGVLETIRIRRDGYSSRLPFNVFIERSVNQ